MTQAPEALADVDQDGDEFATMPAALGSAPRAFRQTGARTGHGGPVLSTSAHAGRGRPDDRRDDHPTGYDAEPVAWSNERTPVVVDDDAPPSRPRAGSTGADPSRVQSITRPTSSRPFDQGIAQHPVTDAQRQAIREMLAATPQALPEVADAYPSSGGSSADHSTPVTGWRAALRVIPSSPRPQAPAVHPSRSRGFRA